MKLSDLIGKTVNIEGVAGPVVLKSVDGKVCYTDSSGNQSVLGRLSDSVGDTSSSVKISLSRITG